MANYIEFSNISPTEFVSGLSRYANSEVIYYGPERKITFTTYQKKPIYDDPNDGYAVIPPGAEYRPDKVSQEVYGVPDFWWKILEANNMKDIYEFKSGRTIKLPGDFF